jgi:cation diffusion facilitator CzcD-associated flavoprotein CzcO
MKSDLAFVLFRKFPGLGKSFFRQHWKDTVDGNTYREHFQPSYNPWQQRIPVAIGLKDVIRNKQLNLVTGRIDRFIVTGIQLEDGRRIDADMCILATGFSLKFFRFPVTIDGERVDTRRINFFKGMMMGGIPNYFQPFGPPHSSFTRRVEAVSRLIVTIIQHMNSKGYASVEIPRTRVPQTPRITPSYVMRELPNLPAFYGTTELPTIDNLLFFHFRAKDYRFSTIQESSETKRFVDDCVTDLEGSTSGG